MSLDLVIAIAALVVAFVGLAWVGLLSARVRELARVRGSLAKTAADGDLPGLARATEHRFSAVETGLEHLRADDAALAERLARMVGHVGLHRYDAFPGASGSQSFSLALLDDAGDGFILTSLYGGSEYRVYAKPVRARGSEYALTPEEESAIANAFGAGEIGAGSPDEG